MVWLSQAATIEGKQSMLVNGAQKRPGYDPEEDKALVPLITRFLHGSEGRP